MLSTIAEIIRDLLIFIGVIAALLVALLVVVSKMPNANPLKRILTALCYRLAATLAAGAIAIPLEPIPGIDVIYDIGVPIVLIWYWFTFFREARRATSDPHPPDQRQVTYGGYWSSASTGRRMCSRLPSAPTPLRCRVSSPEWRCRRWQWHLPRPVIYRRSPVQWRRRSSMSPSSSTLCAP